VKLGNCTFINSEIDTTGNIVIFNVKDPPRLPSSKDTGCLSLEVKKVLLVSKDVNPQKVHSFRPRPQNSIFVSLKVLFNIFDEHRHPYYMGVPLGKDLSCSPVKFERKKKLNVHRIE